MKHLGVRIALLLVLLQVPIGIWGGENVARRYPFEGVAVAGGPSDPDSTGARIFRAGVRADLSEIPRTVERVQPGALTMVGCARCHGTEGLGGPVPVQSGAAYAPPITYADLMAAGYTDATIGRAIRTGTDAHGRTLAVMMPRWDLSNQELAALIVDLKAMAAASGRWNLGRSAGAGS